MTDKSAGEALLDRAMHVYNNAYLEDRKLSSGRVIGGAANGVLAVIELCHRAASQARSASPQPSEPAAPVAARSEWRNPFAWIVEGPKGWLLHVRGDTATEEWWRALNSKGAIPLYRDMPEDHPAFARTAHPEPAAAEPVAWRKQIKVILGGWLSPYCADRATDAVITWMSNQPSSASAPSQPSEGPARVTDEIRRIVASWRNQYQSAAVSDLSAWTMMQCCDRLDAALAAAEGKS